MKTEYRKTADGSTTLYLPGMDEQYHSLNGAFTESDHVFIRMGYRHHPSPDPVIFEVGFGTGLNCLLTAYRAEKEKRPTSYLAIEKYPLTDEVINKLDYGRFIHKEGQKLFSSIHQCEWGVPVQLSHYFNLYKMKADLTDFSWQLPQSCNIIYFDAFGPDKQPEMWTLPIFERLYKMILPGGVIVTYSAKGEVRRRLASAGFSMEKLAGPPGKKEMLKGIKVPSKI